MGLFVGPYGIATVAGCMPDLSHYHACTIHDCNNTYKWGNNPMNAVLNLLNNIVFLINLALFIYIVMDVLIQFDIINRHNPLIQRIYTTLAKLLEPILEPIRKQLRKFLPQIPIDISPVILILLLNFLMDLLYDLAHRV